jgi:hypothetical protein
MVLLVEYELDFFATKERSKEYYELDFPAKMERNKEYELDDSNSG